MSDYTLEEQIQKSIQEADQYHAKHGNNSIFDGYEEILNFEPAAIKITYDHGNGETSEREVDVRKILISPYKGFGGLYIGGFCHLRNEDRMFGVKNIISASKAGMPISMKKYMNELLKDRPDIIEKARMEIGPLAGINFCITGTLCSMKRRRAQEEIEARGGGFHKEIGYNTHFLVAGTPNPVSGKTKAANAHEITIIDEEKFLEYLSCPEKAQSERPPENPKSDFFRPVASFGIGGITLHDPPIEIKPEEAQTQKVEIEKVYISGNSLADEALKP